MALAVAAPRAQGHIWGPEEEEKVVSFPCSQALPEAPVSTTVPHVYNCAVCCLCCF